MSTSLSLLYLCLGKGRLTYSFSGTSLWSDSSTLNSDFYAKLFQWTPSMRQCNWPSPSLPARIPPSTVSVIYSSSTNPTPRDDMAQQPESARFQALFESALRVYEKKAGVSLAHHPLAIKLQNCDSVEAVTCVFQDQARAFEDLQGSDRIMKSIKRTVSISSKLVSQQELVASFTSLTVFFNRHSHPRRRYKFVSLSYLMYVPFSSSYEDHSVTSEWCRQPRAKYPIATHSSTCLSRSNTF
jgi:hypothetical protein